MRFLLLALAVPLLAQQYDGLLNNGRVIDPDSKLDATRSVGVKDGKIAKVSATPLTGQTACEFSCYGNS